MEWDKNSYCILDGRLRRLKDALTSIGDPGIAYGIGAFDTMRAVPNDDHLVVYRMGGRMPEKVVRDHSIRLGSIDDSKMMEKKSYTLDDINEYPYYGHLDRLDYSVGTLAGIRELPETKGGLREAVRVVLQENAKKYRKDMGNIPEFYVRVMVWQGNRDAQKDDKIGVANDAPARYAILVSRYDHYIKPDMNNPMGALIVDHPRLIHPENGDSQAKVTARYGVVSNATHKARQQGYQEALLKEPGDIFIGEGGGENVVCYRKGEFIIPQSDFVLNGFTQHAVAKLAGNVKKFHLTQNDLGGMDAILLTGTAAGIIPVYRLADESGLFWRASYSPADFEGTAPSDVVDVIHEYHHLVSGKREDEMLLERIPLE